MAESGTHEELLKQGGDSNSNGQGIYWEMWQKQLREDNDTDSTTTLGEIKAKTHTDKDDSDDKLVMESETPKAANTEIENTKSDRESLQQEQDDAIPNQQNQDSGTIINNNINNEDITPVMQKNHPTTLPHLDIPSTAADDTAASPVNDEVEEALVSSPVASPVETSDIVEVNEVPDTPVLESPEVPVAPEIPSSSSTQEQDDDKKNKQEKSKPKPKNKKNRKRKSTRNSTTFSR